jgi:hypothetical protein
MSMRLRILLLAGTAMLLGGAVVDRAQAQDRALEMQRFHEQCDHGNRGACVRFGILIGENREREAEWRRTHPEWYWWERER